MSDDDRRPLVSVILPNRNHAHFLPGALEALLDQTLTSLELIVLDDASTDDSRDVIQRFQQRDGRLRFIPLDSHQGIHRSVQAGLKHAKGEFVYIAAADDLVEREFLERCVQEMQRVPQAGLCFSDPSEYYRTTDRKILFPLCLSASPTYFDPDQFVELQARNYFHISPNTGIYRLAAFRSAGGYRQELDLFSDWFVTMVATVRNGAVYLPEQLTCVAIREGSYSATALRDAGRRRAAFDRVLEILSSSDYADVLARFRQAGILPEYHFVTLVWLLGHPCGRKLITPRIIGRILLRGGWSHVRRHMPLIWRMNLRKWVSRWGQVPSQR